MIFLFKKGQVSTEYLVILSVVLVIVLVVVYLVGGFSGLGAGSLETQSKSYWGSASPFAIKAFKVANTNMSFQAQNNDPDKLTITDISIDGTSVYSNSTLFTSGETKDLSLTLPAGCGAAGSPYTYNNVVITYTKGLVSGITQSGAKPLVGKCY